MSKPRFTIEKHQEVGGKLREIIRQYTDIHLEIVNSFPHNTPAAKEAYKTIKRFDELKNQLDNEFYRLEGTTKLKSPYYGPPERK